MGMRAHVVAIDADRVVGDGGLSDDEVFGLLTGPDAAEIDKSWEAAFPLIGSIADSGMMLVSDPVPVGGDLGFGPALFVDPDQVAAINTRLSEADDATIEAHWQRLDSPFMVGGDYDSAEGKDFAMYGFDKTAAVFASASSKSQGVLFAIM